MTATAARLGASYAALMAAHDLGDHIVQTDHQAATKATSWAGMAGHVGSYTALQLAALVGLRALAGVRPSWRRTAVAVAWSAGTHAFLDRRWPVKRILELTGSPSFARSTVIDASAVSDLGFLPLPLHGPYLADQALHHGVLLVAAAILAGGREANS